MDNHLIIEFFNEDGDEYSCNLLLKCISKFKDKDYQEEFNFNRFNITLNFNTNVALIQDEFDTSEAGELEVSLSVFENQLRRKIATK